ncbi:MAG: hypothetical protein GKR89_10040 [Candidatus Latescibacteria bacterium]|nr:hypothetical protein [Candidatus Latescibacterota bacterium]
MSKNGSLRYSIKAAVPAARKALIIEYLVNTLARILQIDSNDIGRHAPFMSLAQDEIERNDLIAALTAGIMDELEFPTFFPEREIKQDETVESLAKHLLAEVELPAPQGQFDDPYEGGAMRWPPVDETVPAIPNSPAVFVLCSPRSGSTLFRLMLAGHPGLFAPPELNLLPFSSMGQRLESAHEQGQPWLLSGPREAFAELDKLSVEQADAMVTRLEQRNVPIDKVYRMLQERLGPKLLVDKSPAYTLHSQWLSRAEKLFDRPLYIHLTRHPCAVIESFVRMRFHLLLAQAYPVWDQNPWLMAEKVWTACNHTISGLLDEVESTRSMHVSYEDLVCDPTTWLRNICQFLGQEYNSEMVDAYAPGRMLEGLGDPNTKQRKRIEPELVNTWIETPPPQPLSNLTGKLARKFGYNV